MSAALGVVSLGCLLGAAARMAHWATHRRDELGRERDLPVLSVSVLVVVALLAAIPGAQRAVEERRLGRVASEVAERKVQVRCQDGLAALVDLGNELGWVAFGADGVPEAKTLIKRDQCRFLDSFRDHPGSPTDDEVVAVHVLTHEAMHMRGETNEARAECAAVQRDVITAKRLGATEEQAFRLAERYWLTVYPRMPEEYVSRECRPGGELDEGLETAPW